MSVWLHQKRSLENTEHSMELLRVPSSSPEAKITVSSPSTSYDITITDLSDDSITVVTETSDASSNLTVALPAGYDSEYKITVDNQDHYYTVVRPYVDPNTKAETASEIAEYAKYETLARAIIDSIIPEGFYYKKQVIQTTGLGSDYIPLWINAHKVLELYENNVLLYDAANPELYNTAYKVTNDKTAIVETYDGLINRLESAQLIMPSGGSDIVDIKYSYRGFPRTFDYKIVLEVGYPALPNDLVRATELLIDDIACGKLDYAHRYMKNYQTDQFKISFDNKVFEGTGNMVVDKILSNYAKSITRPGVL